MVTKTADGSTRGSRHARKLPTSRTAVQKSRMSPFLKKWRRGQLPRSLQFPSFFASVGQQSVVRQGFVATCVRQARAMLAGQRTRRCCYGMPMDSMVVCRRGSFDTATRSGRNWLPVDVRRLELAGARYAANCGSVTKARLRSNKFSREPPATSNAARPKRLGTKPSGQHAHAEPWAWHPAGKRRRSEGGRRKRPYALAVASCRESCPSYLPKIIRPALV